MTAQKIFLRIFAPFGRQTPQKYIFYCQTKPLSVIKLLFYFCCLIDEENSFFYLVIFRFESGV